MSDVQRYQDLMNQIEEAKARQSEARGSLKEIKERLQESFGCANLKEAKAKLKSLEGAHQLAETEADTLMDEIEEAISNAQFG